MFADDERDELEESAAPESASPAPEGPAGGDAGPPVPSHHAPAGADWRR